ncbi:hypothetical protein BQ06660 [Bartonella quintana str. Toulouse]|uniref:Uncharacterized protein n=1 Tax=Bartonella quintana (strain Toulouse) TaxID=283165 RepID=A0A0H3M2W7_BARQU|nr:hypothetical protein BQ06660 [Bartonella quintana str. Toulouse]
MIHPCYNKNVNQEKIKDKNVTERNIDEKLGIPKPLQTKNQEKIASSPIVLAIVFLTRYKFCVYPTGRSKKNFLPRLFCLRNFHFHTIAE